MGAVGAYFSWAVGLSTFGGGRSIGSLILAGLFVAVVPAIALLIAATVLIWILVGVKAMGQAAAEGFRRGRSDD